MQIGNIKPGDHVECEKGGMRFRADVTKTSKSHPDEVQPRTIMVLPLESKVTYRTLKSTEVKVHWRRSKSSTG